MNEPTGFTKCDMCEKDIDLSYIDEYREDDSGIYHEECLEEYWAKEASYALAGYRAYKASNPPVDYSDAYEWGDPKNAHYVAWAMENADALRD